MQPVRDRDTGIFDSVELKVRGLGVRKDPRSLNPYTFLSQVRRAFQRQCRHGFTAMQEGESSG